MGASHWRRVDFTATPWLRGPVGAPRVIGEEWLPREAERVEGRLVEGGGLLSAISDLAGDGFDPSVFAAEVVDFYEHTAEWRLEVWSQWSLLAWPFGWILSAIFARRLHQLGLPLRPLDASRGMSSRVVTVEDRSGAQLGAGWLRTLRSTGQTVFSGWYGTTTLPGHARPSVRVVFPLPNGSLMVFLRLSSGPDGALVLTSPTGPFGDDGSYLVVARPDGRTGWARRVPLAERFVVWVDDEGVLRTDHTLRLWQLPVLGLHYRMERRHRP